MTRKPRPIDLPPMALKRRLGAQVTLWRKGELLDQQLARQFEAGMAVLIHDARKTGDAALLAAIAERIDEHIQRREK